MNWDKVLGHDQLKEILKKSVSEGRISHAQLFVGKEGYGVLPLVLAYVQEIFQKENPKAASKIEHLNHLDLHLSFPVINYNGDSTSKNFYDSFREMILDNPYASTDNWIEKLESNNKQLLISVKEMEDISNNLSLKSYEGGTKILVIWRADKMNMEASNKFLKLLEEPPKQTLIFLTAESTDNLLPTILSRTQITEVPRIDEHHIEKRLISEFHLSTEEAQNISHQTQGNWNDAYQLCKNANTNEEFEDLFISWVRNAFMVKTKPEYLKPIIHWSRDIASWNREKQKRFLDFCAETFRLALMQSYSSNLVYKKINTNGFKWEKFAQYIHGANIEDILNEISTSDYHLERNGNAKIIWTDMGIKLTRYLHRKP